jgi:hypothetical protein
MAQASTTAIPFFLDMTHSEFALWIKDANAVEKERESKKGG